MNFNWGWTKKRNLTALAAVALLAGCSTAKFGTTKTGEEAHLYVLESKDGLRLEITDFGGRVVRAWAPDRRGVLADVTLGWNSVSEYEENGFCVGTLIGRFGNRIADGTFTLDGTTYRMPVTEVTPAPRHSNLHSAPENFGAHVWKARPYRTEEADCLELTFHSPDGASGLPGNVTAKVIYSVLPKNIWRIEYELVTDKPTVVNPTHHTYWNLAGEASGSVLDQHLRINADAFTRTDARLIPVANVPVAGTGFDFRAARPIGAMAEWMAKSPDAAASDHWYDHNFVLRGKLGEMHPACELSDVASGRTLEIWTTEPCLQVYGAQNLDGTLPTKTADHMLQKYAGVALETQHYPDSPNHPEYPTTVLRPGQVFRSTTEYRFGVR